MEIEAKKTALAKKSCLCIVVLSVVTAIFIGVCLALGVNCGKGCRRCWEGDFGYVTEVFRENPLCLDCRDKQFVIDIKGQTCVATCSPFYAPALVDKTDRFQCTKCPYNTLNINGKCQFGPDLSLITSEGKF